MIKRLFLLQPKHVLMYVAGKTGSIYSSRNLISIVLVTLVILSPTIGRMFYSSIRSNVSQEPSISVQHVNLVVFENCYQHVTNGVSRYSANTKIAMSPWVLASKGHSQELEMGVAKLLGEGSGGRLRPPVGQGQSPGRGARGAKPPGSSRVLNI